MTTPIFHYYKILYKLTCNTVFELLSSPPVESVPLWPVEISLHPSLLDVGDKVQVQYVVLHNPSYLQPDAEIQTLPSHQI